MNRRDNTTLKKWVMVTLCCAVIAFAIPFLTTFLANDGSPVVIVLDPGHGGADVGAVNPEAGLYESELNLAIALACRDELKKYDGVEVYMTHTEMDYSKGTMSLGERIDYVNEVNADILISLHCNAAENPQANGSEVYVSRSTYDDRYNLECTELATCFLKQFRPLGLSIRGVKTRDSDGSRIYYHDDGTTELGDYYAVIGGVIKKYGIPGILVEHAFIKGDEALLSSQENLKVLGVADATAIAEHYGLKLKEEDTIEVETQEVVFVTDQDIASASDVSAQIVAMPQNVSLENSEQVQKLRGKYEALTAEGKTLVDKSLVNMLYRAVIELDCQSYPVRITALEDSQLTVNRINHTVSGLDLATDDLSGTNVAALLDAVDIYIDTAYIEGQQLDISAATIIAVNEYGNKMDIGAQVGTGSRLQLWNGGEIIDELTVVIPYDVSGDGKADSFDQQLVEEYLDNGRELSAAALYAADINDDGRVDEMDLSAIIYKIVGRAQ